MTTQYFKKLKGINSIALLRVLLGIIMITHGSARIYYGSVPLFGDFLVSKSIIFGKWIAWIITILDIGFGLSLICNKRINCASYWFLYYFSNGYYFGSFSKRMVCCRSWTKWR
jgi:uncharacterized membrane protein YphA (DoxX/SURF4 family)